MSRAPTFAEIAVELQLAATREAFGLEKLEHLSASSGERALAVAVVEVRRSAEVIAAAAGIFKSLIGHEAEVRKLLGQTDG
ncbi:hypothetical protein GGR16_002385 [Chelatococcus caeni]|uniref:Uncharacterized protein n=1 Tax=Chelatococcus caeni TaxID=1348468 RepID=A0A840C358_9HYPH|nr:MULTISPECIES: hypothetical protein [Chelatococcus]MBB4017356.1 hypothetical protein [Chelatococcus caeni]